MALEIKDLPPIVVVHSILINLQLGDFSKSLAKKLAKTMTKLLVQSAKFINMEEVEAIKH